MLGLSRLNNDGTCTALRAQGIHIALSWTLWETRTKANDTEDTGGALHSQVGQPSEGPKHPNLVYASKIPIVTMALGRCIAFRYLDRTLRDQVLVCWQGSHQGTLDSATLHEVVKRAMAITSIPQAYTPTETSHRNQSTPQPQAQQ